MASAPTDRPAAPLGCPVASRPGDTPSDLVPLVAALAAHIRDEARSVALVALGLVVLAIMPGLVNIGVGFASFVAARGLVPTAYLQFQGMLRAGGDALIHGCFGLGLVLLVFAFVVHVVVRIHRLLMERRVNACLGHAPAIPAADRQRILDSLDLDPGDRLARAGRWSERPALALAVAALFSIVIIVAGSHGAVDGTDGLWHLVVALANRSFGPLLGGSLVTAAIAEAGRRLGDLQVILCRIEAAGKGKGKG